MRATVTAFGGCSDCGKILKYFVFFVFFAV
jgi:hypothetical protein